MPDLEVAASASNSRLASVNLGESGRQLWIHVVNVGDAATVIEKVQVRFQGQVLSGGIVGPDSRILSRSPIAAGEAKILSFTVDLDLQAVELTLRVDHSPGEFAEGAVFVAELEPFGVVEGRPSWQPIKVWNEPKVVNATG
jgi:hypothetical protein